MHKSPLFYPKFSYVLGYHSNADAVLAAKVQHFWFAAKVWKKTHRFIPTHDNNCWFVIDLFDFFEEYRPLGPAERALQHDAREALALSVKQKAAFWKQSGNFWAIKEGDENTKFFHMRASHCPRKNSIRSLTVDGVDIIDHDGKAQALHAFYFELLGRSRPTSWGFDLATLYAGTVQENGSALAAPFDRKEIKAVVWGMDRPSAPGPDGLGPSFFQAAWEHVAPDLERLGSPWSSLCVSLRASTPEGAPGGPTQLGRVFFFFFYFLFL
jgi:hypothetical protein